jgi:hypothetical protein
MSVSWVNFRVGFDDLTLSAASQLLAGGMRKARIV